MDIKLLALTCDDREQFILDNQEAFNYGALEEFGRRDDHFEDTVAFLIKQSLWMTCFNDRQIRYCVLSNQPHH